MTKDSYFEMCDMLGEEPVELDIPLDSNDFPLLVQQTLMVYGYLEDKWDSMSGTFLGKNYSTVFKFFDLFEVDSIERLLTLEILQHIDITRSKLVAEKLKQKSPAT